MLGNAKLIGYRWHVLVTGNYFGKGVIFLVSLEITDIFRGAFLLASGGDLAEIRIRNNGKRIAKEKEKRGQRKGGKSTVDPGGLNIDRYFVPKRRGSFFYPLLLPIELFAI
jgi:hypothetical protein